MQRSVLHSKRSALEWVSFFLIRYICFIFAHSSIKCYFWSAKWFKYGRLNWWEILWTAKCKFRVRPILVAQKLQNWRRTWEQTIWQFCEKMSILEINKGIRRHFSQIVIAIIINLPCAPYRAFKMSRIIFGSNGCLFYLYILYKTQSWLYFCVSFSSHYVHPAIYFNIPHNVL